jgi:hypothetical protein
VAGGNVDARLRRPGLACPSMGDLASFAIAAAAFLVLACALWAMGKVR